MMSSAVQSQKLIFAAGAACVLAIAVVYVLRVQTSTKAKKQKKPQQPEQQQQQQQPQQQHPQPQPQQQQEQPQHQQQLHELHADCKENNSSQFDCSSASSDSGEQRENDRMQISAIAAPEAGDDLRLDSGIGSPKGTPSLENRSNSEQMVEQASDFIEESFSAVYSQTNGIETSSLFVETSSISMVESEPKLHKTLSTESVSEVPASKIEIVEEIFETPADKIKMTEGSAATVESDSITAEISAVTPATVAPTATPTTAPTTAPTMAVVTATDNVEEPAKKLDFSTEASPHREVAKNCVKKDGSPAKEKASRRKPAPRSKDQFESGSVQLKSKTSDDRNNNTRRQSTGSDVVTDSKSEGSGDSSKCSSDSCPANGGPELYQFKHEFELPSELCGKLIGRQGSTVKGIRERTGAIVTVRPHPIDHELTQVYVVGKQPESVRLAMAEIRKRFPFKLFPQLTLSAVDRQGLAGVTGVIPTNFLTLPEDQDTVVILNAIENVKLLFLQLPHNPSYGLFMQLEARMRLAHSTVGTEPPPLPADLMRPNAVCVVKDQLGPAWYRVSIERVISADEVCVRFADYGGFETLHPSRLKQIRSDFIYIPFQAVEVILADIEPVRADGKWTNESVDAVQRYAGPANADVLARVIDASGAIPRVHLTCILHETGTQFSLSHQLVADGHARWATDSNRSSPAVHASEPTSSGPTFSPADFPQLGATQKTC